MNTDLSQLISKNNKILLKDFAGSSFAQLLVKTFHTAKRPLCIITEDNHAAELLKDEIRFFHPLGQVSILPAFDVPLYSGLSPLRKTLLKNQNIRHQLITRQIDFLICPKKALLRRCLDKTLFSSLTITVSKNDVLDREELITNLSKMGYERYSLAEEPGQFAVRGDIIDVFSPQYKTPFRMSLFDIEVEDIKAFNPINQRTSESVFEIHIIPAHEIFLNYYEDISYQKRSDPEYLKQTPDWVNSNWKTDLKRKADKKNIQKTKRDQIEEFIHNNIYFHGIEFFLPLFYNKTGTLFDYLSPNTIIATKTNEPLDQSLRQNLHDLTSHQKESNHIESIFSPNEIFLDDSELSLELDKRTCLFYEIPVTHEEEKPITTISGNTESNLVLKSRIAAQITKVHSLAPLASEINQKRLSGISCYIVCTNEIQRDRIKDLLHRFELPLRIIGNDVRSDVIKQAITRSDPERLVTLLVGNLHEGFFSQEQRQWWITDEEIFGQKTKRASRKHMQTAVFSSFSDLVVGDFIIHMDHGVGIYQGLVKLDLDPNKNDFVLIEYLDGDKLYVPMDKLNRVQRFAASEGVTPQIDKLGGKTWLKTRTKAKKAAKRLARELLELQAKREMLTGHQFTPNTELMEEFAASFEFEETVDQLSAIEEIEKNMQADRPMDRLVCGDVGYGKTEVAMRGVYKAVLDNRQVAVLVPTTVLAFQHYETFKERFKNYPININLLSRFRSAKEQKETIKDLRAGKVDIIIGTHRLLSKDIKFHNLGLLIVDEEHRFGVTHKEKIKKLKSLVDILTLTATPIPRTLNFSLNGIRDLSIINTPPADRLAIRTYTCYFDETTLRDAVMKELRRGGQVFFVHNRVQSIEKITKQIEKIVPEARVRFAHGQMKEDHLEEVMIDFIHHAFDILVCTTIIESGLDIPNANTMLINRADTFGLAQLYQLRGRVGRSDRQAYCYLIVPHETLQTAKARRRLAVIQRFTELGSGFKIASHDLEIRGAGNILGDEQSGHIAAIGYDLYAQLLQEAIHELKNTHIPEDFEPELSLNMTAKIPSAYIPDKQLRLVLYKQLSSSKSQEEVDEIREEWIDRFGTLPEEAENLIGLIIVKVLCQKLLVSQIKQSGNNLFLTFHPDHKIDTSILTRTIEADPKHFSITRDGKFAINRSFESASQLVGFVIKVLGTLSEKE